MRAAVLLGYGDVDQLEIREVPEPSTGPNQIKVRMAAAGLNPIDWKLRSGVMKAVFPLEFPAILGSDASGVVVEVGSGVTAFAVGDRVMGYVSHGYAELVVATVERWARVPDGMELVDAAALPLALLTGAQLIEQAVAPAAGNLLLVCGALGSIGRVAVFLARRRGAKVYAGVRGTQKARAATLGADVVVALDSDRDIGNLPRLDSLADTVGGAPTQKLLGRLKPGGVLGSVVGPPPGGAPHEVVVRTMSTHPDSQRLAELAREVATGALDIPIAKRFPLAEVREAQRFALAGAGGKVLLTVD
jgi:NADPH:quinone reductase-like Zn-dependent oxidoreductase